MANQNLTVYRGTTYDMSYVHPVAMTGGTVYFTVKPEEYDTDADDSDATPKKTITSFTESNTKASWTLTEADLYIEPGDYFYDIIYQDVAGASSPPIFQGKFKVLPHPTNRNVS